MDHSDQDSKKESLHPLFSINREQTEKLQNLSFLIEKRISQRTKSRSTENNVLGTNHGG